MTDQTYKVVFIFDGNVKSVITCNITRERLHEIGEQIANCNSERVLIDINDNDVLTIDVPKLILFFATPITDTDQPSDDAILSKTQRSGKYK